MTINDFLGIISGLSLFLFGMHSMSEGLNEFMGSRLESVLMHMTDHKFKAILLGTLITAIMQSSSAVTVILIAFLNAHIIPLKNAIWVLMGANIGTTITGVIIAFRIGSLSPLFAFLGTLLILMNHEKIGKMFLGIGLLFIGLEMMSLSLEPLKNSPWFLQHATYFSNPIFSLLIGIIFTAMIQSSSAAIGILQNLAHLQLISFYQATFMIFGFDIGTCVTAFIASLAGHIQAKKLALFHVVFNTIGALVFTLICFYTPLIQIISSYIPQVMFQIAFMHSLFNIGTTMMTCFIDDYIMQGIEKVMESSVS